MKNDSFYIPICMLSQLQTNPIIDYQQVTDFAKNRHFENDFTFAGFHCKEFMVGKINMTQKRDKSQQNVKTARNI